MRECAARSRCAGVCRTLVLVVTGLPRGTPGTSAREGAENLLSAPNPRADHAITTIRGTPEQKSPKQETPEVRKHAITFFWPGLCVSCLCLSAYRVVLFPASFYNFILMLRPVSLSPHYVFALSFLRCSMNYLHGPKKPGSLLPQGLGKSVTAPRQLRGWDVLEFSVIPPFFGLVVSAVSGVSDVFDVMHE